MPIRILVVDEQSIYRAGLCELIAAEMPDVEAREVSKLTQIVSCGHCNTMFDLVLVGAGVSNSAALDTLKTAREARVAIRFAIVSAARGKSNKEIARLLHIAEATTKIHMAALLRALGVRNRTEAAFKAASLVDILEPAFREPLIPKGVPPALPGWQ